MNDKHTDAAAQYLAEATEADEAASPELRAAYITECEAARRDETCFDAFLRRRWHRISRREDEARVTAVLADMRRDPQLRVEFEAERQPDALGFAYWLSDREFKALRERSIALGGSEFGGDAVQLALLSAETRARLPLDGIPLA